MCPIHHLKGNKRSTERLRLATVRLKAFVWSDKSEEPLRGFGFVADMSENGVGLYLGEKLAVGESVRVAFESVDAPVYKGSVVWVARYALEQHFVGRKALSFRVGINFLFVSEAERQRFVSYTDSVRKHAMIVQPGMVF